MSETTPWPLRHLRFMTLLEGGSLILLFCIAMPLKYMADLPVAVKIVGPIHGALFLWMIGLLSLTLLRGQLRIGHGAQVFLAAFIPFGGLWSHRLVSRAVSAQPA